AMRLWRLRAKAHGCEQEQGDSGSAVGPHGARHYHNVMDLVSDDASQRLTFAATSHGDTETRRAVAGRRASRADNARGRVAGNKPRGDRCGLFPGTRPHAWPPLA